MTVTITYFVHGTTNDNEHGISTGWNPGELSELGIQQSADLVEQIDPDSYDLVFCSDLQRAIDSAELSFKDSKVLKDARLRECNYGDLNGCPEKRLIKQQHISNPFPNGESYMDVEARMRDFLNFLLKNYNGTHVAIVAHQAPQLALEVLTKGKSWQEAFESDWRKTKSWQPGWTYVCSGP